MNFVDDNVVSWEINASVLFSLRATGLPPLEMYMGEYACTD